GGTAGVAVAFTAVITIGALTLTASPTSSAQSSSLSVQVKVDLNQALAGLASLGYRSEGTGSSVAPGPSYRTDCAANATGTLKQFLERYPCKQYAVAARTVTRKGTSARVAFSWVEMPTSTQADQYKINVDRYRTGNSPGVSLDYNGQCYASGQENTTVWSIYV